MEEEEKVKLKALIHGAVQGVGYRMFACRVARNYGLVGYARNLGDGSVEVVSVGPRPNQLLFLKQLRRGPWGARVDDVICEWAAEEKYDGFNVRF